MVVQDIQEVAQYLELKFSISLRWVDARVLFYNLKQNENLNSLTLEEQQALWTPTIIFWNTKEQLRTVNDKTTFASIKQERNGSIIEKDVNEDIDTFQGSENPITMNRVYSIQFLCEYSMGWYPFDIQTCNIEMVMDGILDNYAQLLPGLVNFTGPMELTQYFIIPFNVVWTKLNQTSNSYNV